MFVVTVYYCKPPIVWIVGLEPTRTKPPDFEPDASTNYAISTKINIETLQVSLAFYVHSQLLPALTTYALVSYVFTANLFGLPALFLY